MSSGTNVNIGPETEQQSVDSYFAAVHSYWRDVYDAETLEGDIYRDRLKAVLRRVDAIPWRHSTEALEVGCGSGILTVELARRGFQVCATDTVRSMIDLTAKRLASAGVEGNSVLEQQDVHSLDYPGERFDLAIGVGVLPWLRSEKTALAELRRVIRPGGILILTADNADRIGRLLDPRTTPALKHVRRVILSILRRTGLRRRASVYPVPSFHTPRELEHLLRTTGFHPEYRETTGFGPLTFGGRRIFGELLNRRIHSALERVGGIHSRFLGNHIVIVARRVPYEILKPESSSKEER